MRKIKRRIEKNKKKEAKKSLNDSLNIFDKIPNSCDICSALFDKKNKEHVTSWSVVVREEREIVRLYCPRCWNKVKQMTEAISESEDI